MGGTPGICTTIPFPMFPIQIVRGAKSSMRDRLWINTKKVLRIGVNGRAGFRAARFSNQKYYAVIAISLTMACNIVCVWSYILDLFMLISIILYILVFYIAVRKKTFSYSFTAVTFSTGVAHIAMGVIRTLLFGFPSRGLFRYVRQGIA